MSTAWRSSTALISTSTPIRERVFIRTGRATSSTTAATRCAASSSAAPSSGWQFHADGLRVDAVASMLYLDYSRKAGSGFPTSTAGRENLESIAFLRALNTEVGEAVPGAVMIAEESTAWPLVSRPVWVGGLGFHYKWDMGWMHDTLSYFAEDPVYRRYHHKEITFRMVYAFNENFVLPLSHDEVVHGKGSLVNKMSGDLWQKLASLRLALRLHVVAAGQEDPVHGRRAGAVPRVESRFEPRLAPAGRSAARRDRALADGSQPSLHPGARAARAGLRSRRFRMDRWLGRRQQRHFLSAEGQDRGARSRGLQLHAGAARQLSHRRSRRRLLARDPQQRCRGLWRQRPRQPGRRRVGRDSHARPAAFGELDAASPGNDFLQRDAVKEEKEIKDAEDPKDEEVPEADGADW